VLKDSDLKSTEPLEVKLVAAGEIQGRLIDDDGLPWAGATIRVDMLDPDRPPGYACSLGKQVITDSLGRFRIEAFVPGVETEVFIGHPTRSELLGAGPALEKPTLKAGELRDFGDITAKPRRRQ
jgi:hypothetical protein